MSIFDHLYYLAYSNMQFVLLKIKKFQNLKISELNRSLATKSEMLTELETKLEMALSTGNADVSQVKKTNILFYSWDLNNEHLNNRNNLNLGFTVPFIKMTSPKLASSSSPPPPSHTLALNWMP